MGNFWPPSARVGHNAMLGTQGCGPETPLGSASAIMAAAWYRTATASSRSASSLSHWRETGRASSKRSNPPAAAPAATIPFSVGKYRRVAWGPSVLSRCGMESTRPRSVSLANRPRRVELGMRPMLESSSTVARGVAHSSASVSLSRPGRLGRSGSRARLGVLPLSFHVADMSAPKSPSKESSTARGSRRPAWPR